jgi:hypothetical protein
LASCDRLLLRPCITTAKLSKYEMQWREKMSHREMRLIVPPSCSRLKQRTPRQVDSAYRPANAPGFPGSAHQLTPAAPVPIFVRLHSRPLQSGHTNSKRQVAATSQTCAQAGSGIELPPSNKGRPDI